MSIYRFEVELTVADAVKLLQTEGKTKGTSFFLHVTQYANIAGEKDRAYRVGGSVKLAKSAVVKFVRNAYQHTDKKGGLVQVRAIGNCVFVG